MNDVPAQPEPWQAEREDEPRHRARVFRPGLAIDTAGVFAKEEAEPLGVHQSLSSSLIAVLARVCASTVLTITAQ